MSYIVESSASSSRRSRRRRALITLALVVLMLFFAFGTPTPTTSRRVAQPLHPLRRAPYLDGGRRTAAGHHDRERLQRHRPRRPGHPHGRRGPRARLRRRHRRQRPAPADRHRHGRGAVRPVRHREGQAGDRAREGVQAHEGRPHGLLGRPGPRREVHRAGAGVQAEARHHQAGTHHEARPERAVTLGARRPPPAERGGAVFYERTTRRQPSRSCTRMGMPRG